MELPQEIMDEIMSYGDPMVTQKHQSVIRQIEYHRKMLDIDSKLPRMVYLGRANVYGGISPEYFYLYILDKSCMKKNIYCHKSKYFGYNGMMITDISGCLTR